MFFFYFENMVMGEKKDEEKLIELIGHLDGEAFQLFFDKFIDNGKLNDAAKDFEKVQTVFLEEFAREEEPQEVITRAPEARLDSSNLTKYLADIEKLYGQADFDNEARIGFLCSSGKDIKPLRTFIVVRPQNDYKKLRKPSKDYDIMQKAFSVPASNSAESFVRGILALDALRLQAKPKIRFLMRTDVQVKNTESKID